MKKFKLILSLTVLFTFLFVVRCSKSSDPAPVTKYVTVKPITISGKVTYTDMSGTTANAIGAVVYLAKSATPTTTYDQSVIAGADGTYKFPNLTGGTYYLNSVYQTDNKNVSARLDGVKFTTTNGYLITVDTTNVTRTQDMSLVSAGSALAAQNVSVSYQWDPTANSGAGNYTNTGAWVFDNIHSPVQFNFPYDGNEAQFAGSFVQTSKFVFKFNTARLDTSSILAIVDLASINTGTPGGRDNLPTTVTSTNEFTSGTKFTKLGCIMGTFGIVADSAAGYKHTTLSGANRYATFTSTSIAAYGDGYLAKGNLNFHGFTVPVNLMFNYINPWLNTSNNKTYLGFEGKMTIAAKTDFGVSSTSVGDQVIIYVTVNLNK